MCLRLAVLWVILHELYFYKVAQLSNKSWGVVKISQMGLALSVLMYSWILATVSPEILVFSFQRTEVIEVILSKTNYGM